MYVGGTQGQPRRGSATWAEKSKIEEGHSATSQGVIRVQLNSRGIFFLCFFLSLFVFFISFFFSFIQLLAWSYIHTSIPLFFSLISSPGLYSFIIIYLLTYPFVYFEMWLNSEMRLNS